MRKLLAPGSFFGHCKLLSGVPAAPLFLSLSPAPFVSQHTSAGKRLHRSPSCRNRELAKFVPPGSVCKMSDTWNVSCAFGSINTGNILEICNKFCVFIDCADGFILTCKKHSPFFWNS